jgi:hypothetical protein
LHAFFIVFFSFSFLSLFFLSFSFFLHTLWQPFSDSVMACILHHLLTVSVDFQSSSAISRASSASWLLSIVNYAHSSPDVQSSLPKIQLAFTRLLVDSRPFTQECAAKGSARVERQENEDKSKAK